MTEPTFTQRDDVISREQQLACVRREIKIRRQVYPTKVAARRMTKRLADYELAAMKAVEQTLLDLINRWPTDGS